MGIKKIFSKSRAAIGYAIGCIAAGISFITTKGSESIIPFLIVVFIAAIIIIAIDSGYESETDNDR